MLSATVHLVIHESFAGEAFGNLLLYKGTCTGKSSYEEHLFDVVYCGPVIHIRNHRLYDERCQRRANISLVEFTCNEILKSYQPARINEAI